jgi:hypothetical protein
MSAPRTKRCVIVLGLLLASFANAQPGPLPTIVHDWTCDTPLGRFGYKDVRCMDGQHLRWFDFGKMGRVDARPRNMAAGGLSALLVLAAVWGMFATARKGNQIPNPEPGTPPEGQERD